MSNTIAIMQPYFFPYLGYYSLIKQTDRFVLFDTVQFIRHGWIERNRILKQNEGWLYIQVPLVKSSRETLIKDIKINNEQNWKNKLLSQLQVYKKKAPYYYKTIKLVENVLDNEYTDIVSLNKAILKATCEHLGINNTIDIFSEMDLIIEEPNAPDEWALNICKALGNIDEYWNPPGGMSFFDRNKYIDNNIELKFQKMELSSYNQKREAFEEGLSIIDVMMFNSVEEINVMLDKYTLI